MRHLTPRGRLIVAVPIIAAAFLATCTLIFNPL